MAGILSRQDQENLIHGHLQAAASKPLNQLRPKTPGNKLGTVSFNDENVQRAQGKTLLKKGDNENIQFGGKKGLKDFATPAATKNRAPLGAKTTNAKARPFGTPALLGKDTNKPLTGSAARRQKIKILQSEPAKVDILQTPDDEVPDIEYMPPRGIDLPDPPEELADGLNLSMFENGGIERDFLKHMHHHKGFDGKSMADREAERKQILTEMSDAQDAAREMYRQETEIIICTHEPDCPTEECKDAAQIRRQAEAKYQTRLAGIQLMEKRSGENAWTSPVSKPKVSKVNITAGPSIQASRKAASALAMSKPKQRAEAMKPTMKPASTRTTSLAAGRMNQPSTSVKPSNPSPMRHTAAVAASNSTLGYGKGRMARVNLRQGVLMPKDSNSKTNSNTITSAGKKTQDLNALSPAEYMRLHGEPKFLSEMWWKCKTAGLIKMPGEEEKDVARADTIDSVDIEAAEREDAEQYFELVLS